MRIFHMILLGGAAFATACEQCGCGNQSDDEIAEAIRNHDEAALRDQLGDDPNREIGFQVNPAELVQGEPAEWLGSYLKYNQLLWTRLYTNETSMCAPDEESTSEEATPPEDLSELINNLGEIAGDELGRLSEAVGSFDGLTALHLAAFFCQDEIVATLLSMGASVDAKDEADMTPLHWATCGQVVSQLCEAEASPDAPSATGLTPLHVAISRDVLTELIACGGKHDARDQCGNTPLHFAGFFGLRAPPLGSNPSSAPPTDEELAELPTWLQIAVRLAEDSVEILRLLSERFDVWGAMIDAGADLTATNEVGNRADVVRPSGGGDD